MTEKLEKLKKLADAMYYAAQYLTTDASRLHKAMDEYRKFIINEYHKEEPTIPDIVDEHFHEMLGEEPVSEDLEEAANFYADTHTEWFDADNNPHVSPAFKAGALWKEEQMMAKAFDGEILENYDGKVIKYDDTILDEKLSDCKVFDKVKIIVIKEG